MKAGFKVEVVEAYLAQMTAQREEIFSLLVTLPEEHLWQRPQPEKWSAAEHLDHTRVLNRSFLRLFRLLWPLLSPLASLRRARPFEVTTVNVFQQAGLLSKAGIFWPPQVTPEQPAPLTTLHDGLALEHSRITSFYRGKEEALLGNVYLYDPAIGWLNLVQALRVCLYHDQHHYDAVRRLLGQA